MRGVPDCPPAAALVARTSGEQAAQAGGARKKAAPTAGAKAHSEVETKQIFTTPVAISPKPIK
jgi:hypothetical protein